MTQESTRPAAPVRTTYAGKMKKRRESTIGKDKLADSSDSDDAQESPAKQPNSAARGKSKPPSKIPRKVDSLPMPFPNGSESSMKPPSSVRKSGPAFASPAASPGVSAIGSMKPPSIRHAHKPSTTPSIAESQDGNSDDDSVSVAGSVKSSAPRKRKGEPERVQFFKDDPNCVDLDPHRALCGKCSKWIALNSKRRYVMQNWVKHSKSCTGTSQKPNASVEASATISTDSDLARAEAEGKAVLENDAKTGEIRPHEVFCTSCAKWIKLDDVVRFAPGNWREHSTNCSGSPAQDDAPPPNDDAREDRHRQIQNDPQVLAFTGSVVTCSTTDCQQDIDLGEDLDVSRWQAHKAVCPPPVSSKPEEVPESLGDAQADPSPAAPPIAESSTSRKRGRDSDSEEDSAERTVRQRSESYKPPRGPALWHTLLKPFRSFVQGFKEGMGSKSSSS